VATSLAFLNQLGPQKFPVLARLSDPDDRLTTLSANNLRDLITDQFALAHPSSLLSEAGLAENQTKRLGTDRSAEAPRLYYVRDVHRPIARESLSPPPNTDSMASPNAAPAHHDPATNDGTRHDSAVCTAMMSGKIAAWQDALRA
jgi:hypothetical protein